MALRYEPPHWEDNINQETSLFLQDRSHLHYVADSLLLDSSRIPSPCHPHLRWTPARLEYNNHKNWLILPDRSHRRWPADSLRMDSRTGAGVRRLPVAPPPLRWEAARQ